MVFKASSISSIAISHAVGIELASNFRLVTTKSNAASFCPLIITSMDFVFFKDVNVVVYVVISVSISNTFSCINVLLSLSSME